MSQCFTVLRCEGITMKHMQLFLVAAVIATTCVPTDVIASLREVILKYAHRSVVQIVWGKALLPCECTYQKLNCSDRALVNIQPEDRCLEAPTEVDLSRNQLSSYPDGFISATVVNATRNRITALPKIDQLNPQITYLDISLNKIHNITESYRSLHSLEVLRLRWNKEITNLSFLPNPCALRILDAENVQLRSWDEAVGECRQLQELDISDNFIGTLPTDAFSTLPLLRKLMLSHNPLRTLSPYLFSNLLHLEVLRLRRIEIESIHVHLFDSLSNLKHLDLAGNSLKLLARGVFSNLVHLTILDLSANSFEVLPLQAFDNLLELQELKLSYNKIKTIPDGAFLSLPNIKEVHVVVNEITGIGNGLFSNASMIEALTLHDNPLSTLPRGLFSQLPGLVFAFVPCTSGNDHWNELSHVKCIYISSCGEIPWRSRMYAALANVEMLLVNNNVISTIANDTLDGLSSVHSLDIGHNEITSLPASFFSYTPNLTFLNLVRNNLTTLPDNIFSGLSHIKDIELANNLIVNLPENVFQGLTALERIDLSTNELSSIPPALFNNLPSLNELSLESNKLRTMPSYESSWPPLKLVSLSLNEIREVPAEALRSWLGSGEVERHVTAVEEDGFGPPPAALRWLLSEAGVQVGRGSEINCRCGCIRRGAAMMVICVNVTCPDTHNGPSRSWVDILRDASENHGDAGNEIDTTNAR